MISNRDAEDLKTETVERCPLCDSDKSDFLFWNFDRLNYLAGKFGLVQCQNCELVRLSPRPAEESLGNYYPQEDYYSYQTPTASINNISKANLSEKIRASIRKSVLNSLGYKNENLSVFEKLFQPFFVKYFFEKATYGWGERFPEYVKDGTALDIGCGNGTYLSFLKHHGWNVKGVEFSAEAAEVAGRNFGIDVFTGELKDAPFEPESFDYVNMSHVLEHVFDPVETMGLVHKLLKKGGIVYIEVPNFMSFSRKQSDEFWYAWETPRHLFTFSPDNLRKLLEMNNFQIKKLTTRVEDLFAWDNTYKIEAETGKKSEIRPLVRKQDKQNLENLRKQAVLSHSKDEMSGDFICCWARK